MTTRVLRKIVKIDEEKCNGCGVCIPACVEGALQIVDGKARLISESYCDGLGACLGECPQGAITVKEEEAEEFDEEATMQHLELQESVQDGLPCGCPSATVTQFERPSTAEIPQSQTSQASQGSRLSHWPVKLTLVPPTAPFLQGTQVLLAADCVPFAHPDFHSRLLKDKALLIACPKLDDFERHLRKLTEVLRSSDIKSLTVVHMEVPCCFGLVHMAKQAISASGKNIPFGEVTVGVRGDLKS